LYSHLRVKLPGSFQAENARLAVLAANYLRELDPKFSSIGAQHIHDGVRDVPKNVGIRGRLETVRQKPRIVVDVAHNADAAGRLVEALGHLSLRNFSIVFGVMKDKNYPAMLQSLSRISRELIAVAPKIERALDSKVVAVTARHLGMHVRDGGSVKRGVAIAVDKAGPSDTILITGSHYVVGEALQALRKLE
jgi:folylpolyglutamate synthase/dihydropteroate synthase